MRSGSKLLAAVAAGMVVFVGCGPTGAGKTNDKVASSIVGKSLTNGDFETGDLSGWSATGSTSTSATAHGGSFAAQLGSASPSKDSSLSQSFTVPAGATLSFWYQSVCPDTVQYDWATAQLKDASGKVLTTLLAPTCSNDGSWNNVQADLSAFAGQSVTLLLVNHDDNYSGDPTFTLFDDVSLQGATPVDAGVADAGDPGTDAGNPETDAGTPGTDAGTPTGCQNNGPALEAACVQGGGFGTGLSAQFGRIDGTLVAIATPGSSQCSQSNATHLLIEVSSNGSTYPLVVNVDDARGSTHAVDFAEIDAALVGVPWQEGWHTDAAEKLDYVRDLNVHSTAFQPFAEADLVNNIVCELVPGDTVSVYALGFGNNGAHDIHRNTGGGGADGAVVLHANTAQPHYLMFHFANQTF